MKVTNFIHPTGWKVSRVFYTALTSAFMFLLLLLSAPTYGQALPDLVDSKEAVVLLKERFAALPTGDTGLEDYYRTKYANDADGGAVEVQLSYWLHEAVLNHIEAGKTTQDAVLYVYTKGNIDMDADPSTTEVLYAGAYEDMRNRIVKEEIIELLKK